MPDTNISAADYGSLRTTNTSEFKVAPVTTDAAGEQKETEWINSEWTKYLGYYKAIPELMSAIDAKATWTVGKGFTSNPITEMVLGSIKGWGKDSFNTILENMIRTYHIGGDAFAEIIRDNDGILINIKPLDPGSIKIVANRQGKIKRYEQVSKTKNPNKPYTPDKILHLARHRVADEIHGVSMIPAIEQIILMRNEAMADYKRLLHRNVYPVRVWHLDTDVPAEVAAFKAKVASAKDLFEDIFIPKGAVETEIAAVPANSTLNPLPWIDNLNQYFFQATGVPDIIIGAGKQFTEASAKIAYLAFEQTIEEEQLYIEEQILNQLNLEINLEFPASLQNEMLSEKAKAETTQAATPEDTTAQPAEISPQPGVK